MGGSSWCSTCCTNDEQLDISIAGASKSRDNSILKDSFLNRKPIARIASNNFIDNQVFSDGENSMTQTDNRNLDPYESQNLEIYVKLKQFPEIYNIWSQLPRFNWLESINQVPSAQYDDTRVIMKM